MEKQNPKGYQVGKSNDHDSKIAYLMPYKHKALKIFVKKEKILTL